MLRVVLLGREGATGAGAGPGGATDSSAKGTEAEGWAGFGTFHSVVRSGGADYQGSVIPLVGASRVGKRGSAPYRARESRAALAGRRAAPLQTRERDSPKYPRKKPRNYGPAESQ